MIGLLLIYFIGKAFYTLAFDYNRNKWLFAVLGIASYYVGTFLAGIILGIIALLVNSDFPNTLPSILLGLIGLPFGLLFCWIFYKILISVWEKKDAVVISETLDSNLTRRY